jgi:hypothetical protein
VPSLLSGTLIVAIISIPQAAPIRTGISQTFARTPAATAPPTATPSPAATPSPTPTPKVVNKNLTIPCTTCNIFYKIEVVLNNILINTSNSLWNFTLTSTGQACDSVSFTRLELEDGTGQQHEGTGLASDMWSMSSGQSISTSADFNLVPKLKETYLLNLTISCGGRYNNVYQTVPFTF